MFLGVAQNPLGEVENRSCSGLNDLVLSPQTRLEDDVTSSGVTLSPHTVVSGHLQWLCVDNS